MTHVYKAVEIQKQKLCHIGNYAAYKKEDGKVIFSQSHLHNKTENVT